jgi:regulatory protein
MTQRKRRRRMPQRATPEGLRKAALRYLERYASSAANLRRVLLARVERSAYYHGTDKEAGADWVDDIVARFTRAGLVDDKAYAELRTARLSDRGYGRRRIAHTLRAKGVDEDVIAAALDGLAADIAEPDLRAAIVTARRRRFGPYRGADRAERRERDMAALARAGFDYDTVRRVIDAADIDDLEAEAEGRD